MITNISDSRPDYKTILPENVLIIRIFLSLIFILSFLNLAGWLTDVTFLKSISPNWIPMNVITSVFFLITGLAIVLIRSNSSTRFLNLFLGFSALIIISVSALSIAGYIYIEVTGEEFSLAQIPVLNLFLLAGNRMAMLTAVLFLFIGIIILLLRIDGKKSNDLAHILTFPVAIASYYVIITYILGVQFLHEPAGVSMALYTGIVFCCICIVIILIRPQTRLMNIFSSKRMGGIMARRLLPLLIVFPVVLGLLKAFSENRGYFKTETGIVLITLIFTFVFIILLWLTARYVNRIDEKRYIERTNELLKFNKSLSEEIIERLRAEESVKAERRLFKEVLELMPAYIILIRPDYTISYANRFFRDRYGDTKGKLCFEFLFNRTEPCEICETYKVFKENRPINWEWTGPDKRIYTIFDYPFTDTEGSPMIMEMGIDITDLKNAESDLRLLNTGLEQRVEERSREIKESENRFRTITESLPVLISMVRASDNIVLFTNEVYDNAFGYSRGEVAGKKSPLQSNLIDRKLLSDLLLKEDSVDNFEIKAKRVDGEEFWLMANVRNVAFENEKALLIASVDITDQKNAIEKLSKLNRTLNSLGKSSQAMMHQNEEQKYLEEVCRIIAEDCGYTMVWIGYAQENPERRVVPVAYTGFREGYLESLRITWDDTKNGRGPTGTAIRTGRFALCKDIDTDPSFEPWRSDAQKSGFASSLSLPLKNDCNAFGALSIYSDKPDSFSKEEIALLTEIADDLAYGIGHIRLTESEKRSSVLLKESEEKYRLLGEKLDLALESGMIGTWEWDLETKKMIWDDRTQIIFGFEPGSFDGTFETFEKCIADDDVPHVLTALNNTICNAIPFNTVFRIKLKDGNLNYICSKGSVNQNDNRKPLMMTGVCYDITDMKKGAEKVLFELNDELLRSNVELEQFAYVASHDLQEPLRMVTSFTQLLSERYKDKLDKDGQEFIAYVVDGAMRMQTQILDLLSLSRIQTRGKKFELVDMNMVVGQAIKNLHLSIHEKNALIINDKLLTVYADEGQMIQLIQNLLENSLKYCNDIPEVLISSREEENHYVFSVKDNGIGIEQKYHERIFQIFQRLHTRDMYGGTGVGLAICKRIVQRHRGKIWTDSAHGNGSTFYFTILKMNDPALVV